MSSQNSITVWDHKGHVLSTKVSTGGFALIASPSYRPFIGQLPVGDCGLNVLQMAADVVLWSANAWEQNECQFAALVELERDLESTLQRCAAFMAEADVETCLKALATASVAKMQREVMNADTFTPAAEVEAALRSSAVVRLGKLVAAVREDIADRKAIRDWWNGQLDEASK